MGLCEKCTQLKPINLCTDSVIIGSVAEFNTSYIVFFKSLATGALYSYPVTSNSVGLLTLLFVEGFPLASGTGYELWVNKASSNSIAHKENLTIGTTVKTCYNISATTVYNMYYDENVNYDSQTLEVE